jgi:hypothetical protein
MSDQLAEVRFLSAIAGKKQNCLRVSVTQMILSPGLITMTIAVTRMHRSLVDYASGFPDVYDASNLLLPFILLSTGNTVSGLAHKIATNYQ